MPRKKRTDWSKERETFSDRAFNQLIKKAGAHQKQLYNLILPLLADLEADKGKFMFSVGNMKKAASITRKASALDSIFNSSVVKFIVKKVEKLLGLNTKYFSSFVDFAPESIEKRATRLTMQKLGYDSAKKKLIKGGYLESLGRNTVTTEAISGLINQGIAGKMSLKDFRKSFRNVLVNPSGLGIPERYFKTKTHDLFQSQDRQINDLYAQDLKLNFGVYSGTLIVTSRDFCKARNGKVFHRSEVASWSELEWQGKPKIYDPFTDLGGYNCRHHLSWISDQIAKNAYGKDISEYSDLEAFKVFINRNK